MRVGADEAVTADGLGCCGGLEEEGELGLGAVLVRSAIV